MEQEQLDPSIVALSKAIGHQESGGDYNRIGDNGHSRGAYQWNNKSKLKEGEIPANFRSYASEVGANGEDFSPANQDRVAYKTIEKWGKQGLTPAQIASKWNSGGADTYKTAKPGYNAEQGVNYDVKKYVENVAKYYDEFKGAQSNSQVGNSKTQNTSTPTVSASRKTFDDIPDNDQPPIADTSLKADLEGDIKKKLGNGVIGTTAGLISKYTPGSKLAQGLGYAINNMMGGQDKLIKANQGAMDSQVNLIKQYKKMKAQGKDTTKLEKAMKNLSLQIKDTGSQIEDAGTGGITNKEVLKSVGSLATLPAMAYGATVLGGGGVMGTGRGLQSGVLGKSSPKVFNSRAVKDIVLGKGETIGNLSRNQLTQALETSLKEMKVSQIGTKYERDLLKALKSLSPALKESLAKRLLKTGASEAGRFIIYNALGDKVGGLVNKVIP